MYVLESKFLTIEVECEGGDNNWDSSKEVEEGNSTIQLGKESWSLRFTLDEGSDCHYSAYTNEHKC